jgi:heptosyltransferase-1
LADLLKVMATCRGVLGVDSGLSHLAVALDLPVVEIFSQARAWRAGPVGQAHQCAVGGDHVPDVAEVWAAWQRCQQAASVAMQ